MSISIPIRVECEECGASIYAEYDCECITVKHCYNCYGNLEAKIEEAANLYPDLRETIFKGVLDK